MFEKIFGKKQEKIQEKIQKQQELNDKDCCELTDEEMEQVVGGAPGAQAALKDAQLMAQLAVATAGAPAATLKDAQGAD